MNGGRTFADTIGLAKRHTVRSATGDEPSKISDRDKEDAGRCLGAPVLNLKEGPCASGFGRCGMLFVV